jgi:hypothetical protein
MSCQRVSGRVRLLNLGIALWMMGSLGACGGGGDDSNSPLPSPGGSNPPPSTSPTNPCSAVSLDLAGVEGASTQATTDSSKRLGLTRDKRDVRDGLWEHYLRGAGDASVAEARTAASQDIGDIAVIEDDTTLMLRQNAFDLKNTTLRFEKNSSGGYDVTRLDAALHQSLGNGISLTDDATSQQSIQFSFPYYNTTKTSVFVNSDGNLTFDESDTASTERGFTRLLGGPGRIAPFFADLDPSAGGGVFVRSSSNEFVVTWCSVRAFESSQRITVQAALLPSGNVEVTFGDQIDVASGIVALSPGRTETFTPVDLSGASARTGGGAQAVGERFSNETELDTVSASKRFYQTHGDNFDQLIFWSDTTVVSGGTFAFESSVANEVRGIGMQVFDNSRDYGSSGGRLRSFVVMDRLGKYPDNPASIVLGENSTLSVMGQEVGHRWLAFLRFRDTNGQSSTQLLGRDNAHWSFFMDSDASVMEGNDIEDLGGGSFRTVGAVKRYSRLDMYAMGLATPDEVSRFFYVDSPINIQPSAKTRESGPATGVTFNGTRRDVLIQDVIDAMGARTPTAAESPRVFRQAFIYIVSPGNSSRATDVQKLDRIRREWVTFFNQATEGRMTSVTSLQ